MIKLPDEIVDALCQELGAVNDPLSAIERFVARISPRTWRQIVFWIIWNQMASEIQRQNNIFDPNMYIADRLRELAEHLENRPPSMGPG